MTRRSKIVSTGAYLPEKILTNADLSKMVDTNDEWIQQRTGIKQRHIAADDQKTSDLAIEAARQALERSGYNASDIDGIIVATTTPDRTFPSVAVHVQAALDIPQCMAFDVQAVCTGFVYALSTADAMIKVGNAKRILVIGAEKMSSILDWTDRITCVLFGDGAGAVILEAIEDDTEQGDLTAQGVHSTHLFADGRKSELLYTNGGVSTTGDAGHIVMKGRDVFKYAVSYMADVVEKTLAHNNIEACAIDWLVPHQANVRIIESTAKKLGMSMDKVVLTLPEHGNTSAASIPLALNTAVQSGDIKRGEMLLLEGMGGGLTWGAALVRF